MLAANFETELDAWAELEGVPPDLLLPVLVWVLDRMDDPYDGVQRAEGFENLWHGSVPASYGLVPGRVVTLIMVGPWVPETDARAAGPGWPRAPARGQHRSADRSALLR